MQSPARRRRIVTALKEEANLRKDYLVELGKSFREAESSENAEALFDIFYIYKNIVTYSEQKVIECLLSDEFYLDMFGAFERKSFSSNFLGDPTYLSQDMGDGSDNETLIEEEFKGNKCSEKQKPKVNVNGGHMMEHRDFLQKSVNFKKVVEMEPEILEKIHIVFRV
jgi:hypothetical protein